MTVREHLSPGALEAAVRAHPRLSAAVRAISERTRLPEEVVRGHLTESLRESLDGLGDAYVAHVTEKITAVEGLRHEVRSFYDHVLDGTSPDPDVAHLQDLFRQLHDTARDLNDPQTWAKEQPAGEGSHPAETAQQPPADKTPPPEVPPTEVPGAAEAQARAQAVRTLRERAEAAIEKLEAEVREKAQEADAARAQVPEINKELTRRGVDLRRLSEPAYVEKLPPDVQALIEKRAELADAQQASFRTRAELQQRIAAWRRAASSDVVARRYAELRPRTPEGAGRAASDAAQVDVLGVPRREGNPIEPDHVVPVAEVVAMDNFVLLPDDVALAILNDPEFIEPLNRSANRSKSDWAWEDWPNWAENGVTEPVRAAQIEKSRIMRKKIYDRIQAEAGRLVGTANLMPAVAR